MQSRINITGQYRSGQNDRQEVALRRLQTRTRTLVWVNPTAHEASCANRYLELIPDDIFGCSVCSLENSGFADNNDETVQVFQSFCVRRTGNEICRWGVNIHGFAQENGLSLARIKL